MKVDKTIGSLQRLNWVIGRALSKNIWVDQYQFDYMYKSSKFKSNSTFTLWNEFLVQGGHPIGVFVVWCIEAKLYPEKFKMPVCEQMFEALKIYETSYSQMAYEKSGKVFKNIVPQVKKALGIHDLCGYLCYNLDADGAKKFSILFNLVKVGSISPAFYLGVLNRCMVEQSVEYLEHCSEEENFRKAIRLISLITF